MVESRYGYGKPEYVGDGVYAEFDGYHVWIWTSDGVSESPRIALESAVLEQINRFHTRKTGQS